MAGDQRKFQTAMIHGDRFSEQGNWQQAMKAYRFALAEFPNNAPAIIGFGRAALSAGQSDLARRAFVQSLKINPTNLDALNHMGDLQERTGQLDAAAETYLRMGNVYASRNKLDTAIDFWTRSTKLIAGHVDAHRRLAEGFSRQGKTRIAAREFLTVAAIFQRRGDAVQTANYLEVAAELLPKDPGIIAAEEALRAGEAIQAHKISDTPPPEEPEDVFEISDESSEDDLFDLDDLFIADEPAAPEQQPAGGLVESARQKALGELANLIFEDNDDPNAIIIMQAVDMQSRNDRQGAIKLYHQAIDSGSEQPAIYFNLGLLYREQGQLSEAAENLDVAVTDQDFAASANFSLGETYFAINDFDLAVRHFVDALSAIDLQTVSGNRYYNLAQTYNTYADNFLSRNASDKIKIFISSVQNFFAGSSWEGKVYDARARMNSLSEDDNTMSLAEYLETPETEVMVNTLSATTDYIKQNFLLTASEECLRAIQKVPSFLPLHARLAEIMLKQDRTDDAITKYLFISKVYQMRNQADQAISIYHKILKLAPMDVTVRAKLIDMYTSYNKIEEALEQYLVLANSYYQLAQVDRAIEKYNEAIRLSASLDNANGWKIEALTRIADIYNQRFDWAGATTAFEELYTLTPSDSQIMRQLVELYYKQVRKPEAVAILDDLLDIYQRQSPTAGLDLLRDLVSLYPDDMSLRQRLAVAYAQNDRTKDAISEYDTLGEMQLEVGQRDQAIQTIQAIINLGPDDVEGYHRLLSQIGGGRA